MSQADLANRLNEAIALINAGRREEARAILLPLSQQYPNLEQVWMWLATATDDTDERVTYLQRVLSLNPRNEKARSAYTRLTGKTPSTPDSAKPTTASSVSARTIESWLIALLGIAALVTVMLLISAVVGPLLAPKPTETLTPTSSMTFTPSITYTPSITPGGPTLTPFTNSTLPPSWTPSDTLTPVPTNTHLPTSTPLPSITATLRLQDRASYTPIPTITPGGPTLTDIPRTDTPVPTPTRDLTAEPDTLTPVATAAQ
ncbi:MAG: hypothetical protein ABI947_12715 [Chloroflexota bacterium]